jgi:16S rRNA (uracil1498-N3)-methyltransferase
MSLSFFFAPDLDVSGSETILDEPTSKHCVQVLRMRAGDSLVLTNGKGHKATALIRVADKRHCAVQLSGHQYVARPEPAIHIGIAPLKNSSRFEWFLEKATEIGVAGIIPLLCERTEKETFRLDRLTNILVAAMLQSEQAWLPTLTEPQSFAKVLETVVPQKRYIAHCMEGNKKLLRQLFDPVHPSILLIGPEGDFTPGELGQAVVRGWLPVSLGNTRLRTETAGIVAATQLRLG